MVMSQDEGNSGLLLRLTGADDGPLVKCCCGNVNDLALVMVDKPTNKSITHYNHKLVPTC